jgi:hypothetical protein
MIEDEALDIQNAIESLESSVMDVKTAVEEVKDSVESKKTSFEIAAFLVLGYFLLSWIAGLWYSKVLLSARYNVNTDNIVIDEEPHDCDFLHAPIGVKSCDYTRKISTVQYATSKTGEPIKSVDEGKTWETFTPDPGQTVLQSPKVEYLYVTWTKDEK